MIIRVYKTTLIEALEVETFTLPLNLYIEKLTICIIARIHITKIINRIKIICNYI
jgi:hypothetical protein